MKTNRISLTATALLTLGCLIAVPATFADEHRPCSIESIAGSWVFATDVGRQALVPDEPGDITAIGTMNITKEGLLDGVFDNTIADFLSFTDNTYSGSVTVTPDCLGELTFVTSTGSMRVDTIAIASRDSMLGMSRDPNNLWNYQMRRISRSPGPDALAAKVDAIMRVLGLRPEAFESAR